MGAVRFEGGCHCGNLHYVFEATAGLDVLGLRACQCRFCRAHNARTTSDPSGTIRIAVRDPQRLARYRFGLNTADFLICSNCGVFIGAVMEEDGAQWMTINANSFVPPPPADASVAPMDFGSEDTSGRTGRRKQRWTPVAEFEVESS